MKISVDAMGGDYAPAAVIGGVKDALRLYPKISHIFLVGDKAAVEAECAKQGLQSDKLTIVHASEVIGMAEPGAKSIRRKKDSSIGVAIDLVKSGQADAFVSAGNTGAAVAGATLKLRLIPGVERAGIATALPNEYGVCNLLDAGANPEAKPSHLVGYALMGTAFARSVQGIENPRVGLMSNGEEDEKGTTFTKETFALLKQTPGINFVGNVEGRDLFQSEVHVVLCDGFVGNIILKSVEGCAKAISQWLKEELKANPIRMVGAAISKNAFAALKQRTSYEYHGGSPLLGVNGVVIIAHGSSSPLAIQNAIRVAYETAEQRINGTIEKAMAHVAATQTTTSATEE